jgi:hypothetical protein
MLDPQAILEAALALEPTERARLAKKLLDSLDKLVTVELELAADVERRIREVESGTAKATSGQMSRCTSRAAAVPAETPVRFRPEADEEVHVIADWYDDQGQGGKLSFEALGDTVDRIAAAPWRWPIAQGVTPAAHRNLMPRLPYSVYTASTTKASSSSSSSPSPTSGESTSSGSAAKRPPARAVPRGFGRRALEADTLLADEEVAVDAFGGARSAASMTMRSNSRDGRMTLSIWPSRNRQRPASRGSGPRE